MQFFLRPISEFDIQQIRHINDLVQEYPWSLNQILNEYEQNHPFSMAACQSDGKVIGYIFTRQSGDHIEITALGVAPDSKRQGVASTLVHNIIQRLREKGSDLFLEVSEINTPAISFYESLGFARLGFRSNYYRDGSGALCMKLNLAKP